MIKYEKVRSTVKPKAMTIDEYNVWVCTNIADIEENDFAGYEYDMVQYTKDEYIQMLDAQLTNTQLALCELYEGMVL